MNASIGPRTAGGLSSSYDFPIVARRGGATWLDFGLIAGITVLASKKRQRHGDMAAGTFVILSEDCRRLTAPLPAPPAEGGPADTGPRV